MSDEKAEPQYALIETVGEAKGYERWFVGMTAIGPMASDDLTERALFPTEEAARQSPAMLHPLSCFEPREVVAGA